MRYCGKSDIGLKREENQDSYIVKKVLDSALLAVVCDGMGGAAGGKTASETASRLFCDSVSQDIKEYINSELDISSESQRVIYNILINAVNRANSAVYTASKNDEELHGMGTTLTAALFIGRHIYMINIGDSRIYTLSDKLIQITKDHSYVQTLIDIGKITEEEAVCHPKRNIITRAIGIEDNVIPDTYYTYAKEGETYLLCSDGLCGYVPSEEIIGVLRSNSDIKEKTDTLIDLANLSGGSDNVTAVLVTY